MQHLLLPTIPLEGLFPIAILSNGERTHTLLMAYDTFAFGPYFVSKIVDAHVIHLCPTPIFLKSSL